MEKEFNLRVLAVLVFCAYEFWAFYGLDITMSNGAERFPLHRFYIALTLFLAALNIRCVLRGIVDNASLITLFLYTLLGVLWANDSSGVVKNFIFLFSALFISILVSNAYVNNYKVMFRYLYWLSSVLIILSIFVAIKYPNIGVNVTDFGRPRWIGITDHPNSLGGLVLLCIWVSTNLFFNANSTIEKLLCVVSIFLSVWVVLKADSMTSLGASVFVVAYSLYLYIFGKSSLSFRLVLILVGVFSALVVMLFYMSAEEIATETLAAHGRDTTLTGRSKLWHFGLDAFSDNILFGYGFDELEQLTRKYHTLMSHLHNGYIEVLVKGGLLGEGLLLFILVSALWRNLRLKKFDHGVYVALNTGLIGILIHNLAESSFLRGLNGLNVMLIFVLVFSSTFLSHNTRNI